MSENNGTSQEGSNANEDLTRIAERLFELTMVFWALRHKNRTEDPLDLTESEFATLDTLDKGGVCTVGTLQKALDVQPAQMSRIIRSLEDKGNKKLVECNLNLNDKRRIDVVLTKDGVKAHKVYRTLQIKSRVSLVSGLSPEDRRELVKLLDRFGQIMSEQMGGGS